MSQHKSSPLIGTASYDNWCAFNKGQPLLEESEYLLYTDAWLTGQVDTGLGPYALFNLVPYIRQTGLVTASVALRLSLHLQFQAPNLKKPDQLRYHGGWMTDEIAALASLNCGVRFRCGSEIRRFEVGASPKGRPVFWNPRAEPSLSLNSRGRGLVLPGVAGEHSMMPAAEMKSFPLLSPLQAIALVRAARLYQDSLWLAESEPNLSWLMLVAAVESAANIWRSGSDSPRDRLIAAQPKLVEYLESTGVAGITEKIAATFADSTGVTKKFIDFLIGHLPPAPTKRPPEWAQVEWSSEGLRRAFAQIYKYRSKALHDGIPFPAPMCEPPVKHDARWEAVSERPDAIAMSTAGGTWRQEDTPMLLQTFEYVARHALVNWWKSMAPPNS